MNSNFDDYRALTQAAHILLGMERIGLAHPLLERAAKLRPGDSVILNNLGFCYREGHGYEEAEKIFIKALSCRQEDPIEEAKTLNNLAHVYVCLAQPRRAIEAAEKALKLDPTQPEAQYNRGQALLMLGEYESGWQGYEMNLGRHSGRKERLYGTIPRWTGVKGLTVVAYGEQGLGDEISFASCIPDLQRDCKEVIIESDKRLGNLFRRSFGCKVYGTRFNQGIAWAFKHEIDASVAFGSLPGFYRNSEASFPGEPYLIADPQRRVMYRALLDSLGPRMKVGIAWSGGRTNTGKKRRSIDWQELMPIFRQHATFVSLQYEGCPELAAMREAGVDIHHFPNIVQAQDYDETAALVAELDLVITVQQAAVHLAGALGTPCFALIPKIPIWRYRLHGDSMPWYKSVKLFRQRDQWVHPISDVATELRSLCSQ